MIKKQALDTNILVRLLVNDDKTQATQAYHLLKKYIDADRQLFVSATVILELIWVLSSSYRFVSNDILDAINKLLQLSVLQIEYRTQITDFISYVRDTNYDLSDILIGYIARANGCQTTITFDKKAATSDLFTLLAPVD